MFELSLANLKQWQYNDFMRTKLILVAIIILLAGILVYTMKDNFTRKTYSNSTAGYEYKYPKDWNAETSTFNSQNSFFGPDAKSNSGIGGVEFVGTVSPSQSIRDFVKDLNLSISAGSTSETETTINGQKVVVSILPGTGGPSREVKIVSFQNGNKIYNAYVNYQTEDSKKDDLIKKFDNLTKTFKFNN